MGEILIANAVARETGYLYYVDGLGNICRAKLQRAGRRKKTEEVRPEAIEVAA